MDLQGQNGLDRTFREGWRSKNGTAWLIAVALILFYLDLYYLADPNLDLGLEAGLRGAVGAAPADGQRDAIGWLFYHTSYLAEAMGLRNRWFLYALLYTIGMVAGGIYYLRHHGNARYNQYRIAVNIAVQVSLAFLLPFVMPLLAGASPGDYWKWEYFAAAIWPLDWYKLRPDVLGAVPLVFAITSVVLAFLVAPLAAFFFGKRWYCSWVCGCGGLANTFGDPWRHLTPSSTASWRFEKIAVHTVMFLAIVSTGLLVADQVGGWRGTVHEVVAGSSLFSMKSLYGMIVGALLAGVVGVGLYPLLGARVWCRNFCPMAALLGLQQKLGRFRITVKPDMCISCGNCTTYCEMGIDVRSYAQSNESFTRASCVGCGMCAHVCPRGVLRLENVRDYQGDKRRTQLPVVDL
ncbi:MAG: 4Fe-4S binding protein [Sandaracinaceae bacterium]